MSFNTIAERIAIIFLLILLLAVTTILGSVAIDMIAKAFESWF